jgi:cell wall-associated NlpC family hydrolase
MHLLALALSALLFLSACSSSKVRTTEPRAMRPVIEQAMDLMGTSYCSAGSTPDCFDCSGFVSYCFQQHGISLPRVSADMYTVGAPVDRDDIQGGDLVFFAISGGRINHVGIALNNMQFIHSSSSKGVSIAPFSDAYWAPRYKGARRVTNYE